MLLITGKRRCRHATAALKPTFDERTGGAVAHHFTVRVDQRGKVLGRGHRIGADGANGSFVVGRDLGRDLRVRGPAAPIHSSS
jgi:hypothetical protein